MTGGSRGQPDQHRKGGLFMRQRCYPALSEGLGIELSDIEEEDATLTGDYLWQVVEIVIAGVPTVFEVRFMCYFMFLGRILL
jgi:hypothetical protein